jgi:flavin reductase (DIM6/NTAB) family NADH-FMN oxidoreductase RutF
MSFDPEKLDVAERYKLMVGAIVPRPIAFVSTVSPDGRENLAPYSFFCGVGSNPMTVAFCPASKGDGTDKDSLRNSLPAPEGVGHFVVNVATEAYAREMAACGEELAWGESEFDLSGLTPAPSVVVRPPRVLESPVAFECETLDVIRTNPGAPGGGNLVLGRVVWVHAAEGLVDERFHVDADALAAIGRMGGAAYVRTRDRFDLPRGRAALEGEG